MQTLTHAELMMQRRFQSDQNEMSKQVATLIGQGKAAKEENSKLALALALEQSSAAAMLAVIAAFKKAHPDSPLLRETGRTLENGRPETVMYRDIFAPTFDAEAASRRINNPESKREVAR